MSRVGPRVVVALVGAVDRGRDPAIKYGELIAALRRRWQVVAVVDASLRGPARWLNAAAAFHPHRAVWRERFIKSVPAFGARSRQAAQALRRLAGQAEVVLQVGGLFDASGSGVPVVIYTDYTAQLSAQRPEAGRSPLTGLARDRWFGLERAAYHQAAHVATRARQVRASLIGDYGLAEQRVTAIGGGVNFHPLPKLADRPETGQPRVLFIGKDFYRKGGDRLLRAFAEARRHVPSARLSLVTGGPLDPGLPLEGVDVVAPTWDRNTVASWYQRADVFVLPSRLETWGDVLLEAMAYGLPCVGVAGQGMADMICPEETGYVVGEDDPAALAETLVRLLSDSNLRRRLGAAGRQRVEEHFTWDTVVERLAPLLMAAAQPVNGSSS